MVSSLLLILALAASSSAGSAAEPQTVVACTVQRLRAFVGPLGIQQPWPTIPELPAHLDNSRGELLSDQGNIADGYTQTLHVDSGARAAYVVQQGGFAGFRRIYGPLPVASCPGAGP